MMQRFACTDGFKNGLTEPTKFNVMPTGQSLRQKNLFSFRLSKTATMGIIDSSMITGIILPVMVVHALRWNMPRVTTPIGQTTQKMGKRRTAEPTTEMRNMPFAVEEPNRLFRKRGKGQVGQAATPVLEAFLAASSLLR